MFGIFFNSQNGFRILCMPTHSSVEEHAFLHCLPTDRAFGHTVATQLTRGVTTQEHHVLQSVHADGTSRVLLDVVKLLRQLGYVLRCCHLIICHLKTPTANC